MRTRVAVVAAICFLAFLAFRGLQQVAITNSAERIAQEKRTEQMFQCVEDETRRLVPDGARIFIDVGDPAWIQRLTTLVYPRLEPVGNAYVGIGDAEFAVGVIGDPTAPCNGLHVFARRL